MRVFVEPYRLKVLSCLKLSEKVSSLLTTEPNHARIHVGPMSIASPNGARIRLRQYRRRFSNVVAIRPTGWTFNGSTGDASDQSEDRLKQRDSCH